MSNYFESMSMNLSSRALVVEDGGASSEIKSDDIGDSSVDSDDGRSTSITTDEGGDQEAVATNRRVSFLVEELGADREAVATSRRVSFKFKDEVVGADQEAAATNRRVSFKDEVGADDTSTAGNGEAADEVVVANLRRASFVLDKDVATNMSRVIIENQELLRDINQVQDEDAVTDAI
jgi:hypothetical protein